MLSSVNKMKTPYQNFYSKVYQNKNTFLLDKKWQEVVKKRLSIQYSSKRRILDIACGVSTLGMIFGSNISGLEINPEAVKVLRKLGIKVKKGDVEKKWDFPDNHFNIVIASHIIEHVVNPDHLISEAKRVLKKDGILIIATPNLAAWFNRILLLLGYQPFFTEVSTIDKTLGIKFTRRLTKKREPLGHLRLFTQGALSDILDLHGFKIIKFSGAEFLGFPKPIDKVDQIMSKFTPIASTFLVSCRKKS